ncbi:unnamed protein product, partial [Amoebophrya sp. A25]
DGRCTSQEKLLGEVVWMLREENRGPRFHQSIRLDVPRLLDPFIRDNPAFQFFSVATFIGRNALISEKTSTWIQEHLFSWCLDIIEMAASSLVSVDFQLQRGVEQAFETPTSAHRLYNSVLPKLAAFGRLRELSLLGVKSVNRDCIERHLPAWKNTLEVLQLDL